MRPVPMADVIPGMILAKDIFDVRGQILLAKNVVLHESYIRKLILLGITRIYITDSLSEGVEPPAYLGTETQQRAFSILSKTLEKMKNSDDFSISAVNRLVTDIVEELFANPHVLIHLTGIICHNDHTFAHSINCGIYAAILANALEFSQSKIKELTCGALLHDTGKIVIDNAILNKPGKLDEDEMDIMKQHTSHGFTLLRKKREHISSLIAHIAWQHHERYDGAGYPQNIHGSEILNYARILSIVDVYEALVADRPYRKAMTPSDACKIIRSGEGTQFDPKYCQAFLEKVSPYSPGMLVLLNTGERALVVATQPNLPHRPLVRIFSTPDGIPCKPADFDLSRNLSKHIVSTLY